MKTRKLTMPCLALALALGFAPFLAADELASQPAADEAQAAAPSVDPLEMNGAPVGESEDWAGSGNWRVVDGGNYYLGLTTAPGMLVVKNDGPGRVSVHIQAPDGSYSSIHLPPGGTLKTNVPPNFHVEIWDGGRDGIGASGSYSIP